jgi:hypothetical protein
MKPFDILLIGIIFVLFVLFYGQYHKSTEREYQIDYQLSYERCLQELYK